MSQWIGTVTAVGEKALNDLMEGKALAYVEAKGCAGSVAEAALADQTDLPGWTQSADIPQIKRGSEGVTAKLVFGPAEVAYNLRRIGLWIRAGDGAAVMAAIFQHTADGVSIPTAEESPNFEYTFYAGLPVKNGELISVTLEPTAEQEARDDAAASATQAQAAALNAANAQSGAETARDEAAAAAETAKADAETVETVYAAMYARRRVIYGAATEAERLGPGDTLVITDDSSAIHTTDYEDLLLAAQRQAVGALESDTGEESDLATLATLSAVNATNLRRDAEGLLWTTDTLAEFRDKLTAFAAAAVEAGYVAKSGKCVATWAQCQAWLIYGELLTPTEAETISYPWRTAAPKTELDEIKERLTAIEAILGEINDALTTAVCGA